VLDVPATPDRPVEAPPSLRAQVAARVAAVAHHLPADAREQLVTDRVRFLARWGPDRLNDRPLA
jgi:hypothetical protein